MLGVLSSQALDGRIDLIGLIKERTHRCGVKSLGCGGREGRTLSNLAMFKRFLLRLVILGARRLAADPAVRAEIRKRTVEVSRTIDHRFRPKVERAWREVRPKLETARVRVSRFVEERRWKG